MKKKNQNYNCPVSTALNIIGGKYKPLILWHLLNGTLRFSGLKKLIPGVTAKMLTQQLRELENNALISRKVFPVVPPKVEYSLTQEGKTLKPVLSAMFVWGSGYLKLKGLTPNCTMITDAKEKNTGARHACLNIYRDKRKI